MGSEEIRGAEPSPDSAGRGRRAGGPCLLWVLIALLSLAALGVFVGTDLMHSREGKWLSIEQMSAPGTVDGRDVSTNGRLPYSLPACDGSGVLLLGDYASVEDVGKATTTTLGATYTTSRACGSLGGNSDTPEYFVVYLPVLGGRDDLCQALKNTRERLDTSVRATLLDDEPHTSESLCPRVAG